MYFPYLRGRQFELIALRELLENNLIGKNIIPIIEPIKPTSTFFNTVGTYMLRERSIAVIHNPQVGNFNGDINSMEKKKQLIDDLEEIYNNDYVLSSHIMNENSEQQVDELLQPEKKVDDLMVIHKNIDYIESYEGIFSTQYPRYVLIQDETSFRRKIKANTVLLSDPFKHHKRKRNADYLDAPGGIFSEEHLFYKDEKHLGFSDYSIAGEEFTEGGFAPFAVAIHIVYFDKEKRLCIKHFTSKTNDDIRDPAGKFGEALKKLVQWYSEMDEEKVNTYAMNEFISHYKNGTYPALGTVKKLSIMHHIELISKYLDEVDSDEML